MFLENSAKGKNDWILYLLGIALVIVFYVLGQIPLTAVQLYKVGQDSSIGAEAVQKFAETMDFSIFGIHKNLGLILLILMFFFAMAGLLIALKIQNKKLKDLITPYNQIDVRRILFGFGFWMLLTLVSELIMYFIDPNNYSFRLNGGSFIVLLLISFIMLPVQTSFEELFFRGYIMQGIAFHSKSKGLALLVSSILFGLIHGMNPEVEKFGFWTMMAYYITAGLFLGLITIMDDRLELALGIHAATNIYGATIATYEGSVLQTDSLMVNKEINPLVMLLIFVFAAGIFYLITAKKYNWQTIDRVFEPIQFHADIETSESN